MYRSKVGPPLIYLFICVSLSTPIHFCLLTKRLPVPPVLLQGIPLVLWLYLSISIMSSLLELPLKILISNHVQSELDLLSFAASSRQMLMKVWTRKSSFSQPPLVELPILNLIKIYLNYMYKRFCIA